MKNLRLIFVFILLNYFVNAQVVINEVMHKPATSSSVNQGLRKKEYIEIYNKGCTSIDISCWIVGSGAPLTGTTPYWVGAYQFPTGTSINPGQHLVIGGTLSDNNTAYNPSDIDFDVNSTNTCQAGSGGWLLPNGDGWVAIYNSSGIVEDALYWSVAQNPNLNTDNDFSVGPCVPITSCSGITSLMSCREIAQNYPSKLSYGGLSTSFDKTFSRVPDGGSWTRDVDASIAGNNQCNNGQCSSAATFQISSTVIQPSCTSNSGSITLNVTPINNYLYNWNPNVSNNNTSSGLAPGSYSVNISAGGCSKDTVINLLSGNSPNNIVVNSNNPSCNLSNGSVTLGTVSGGTAPYQYNFNSSGFSSSTNFTGLAAGTYPLIVKDANGCEFTATSIVLASVPGPNSASINTTNPSCGQNNGSIVINSVSGGLAPFQYNFNSLGYSNTTTYSGLSSGSFSISIKDANGCVFDAPLITLSNISGPTIANITFINPSCGQNNGSISVINVTGGTAPYLYSLNTQGFSSSVNYLNLAPGNYAITVKDANGCIYNVAPVALANSNGPSSVSVNNINPTCNNNNGSVIINAVVGGAPPYQYNFNSTGFNTSNTFSGLSSGTYPLIIKDAGGCVFTAPSIVLSGSGSPTSISINPSPSYCNNTDGALTITGVSGGTAPYQYSLNNQNFSNVNSFTSLAAGTYSISVVDVNNCSFSRTVVLNNTTITMGISSDITEPSCEGSDGIFKVTSVNGGSAPYQYSFNDGVAVSIPNFTNLSSGNFPFVVIDRDGCKSAFTIDIPRTDDEAVFYAPNTFTPNDDEVNDRWFVETNCLSEYKCYIYNRWGESIAVLDEVNQKWDGNYKNNQVQDGIYVYIIYAKDFQNRSIIKQGQILVLK